MKVSLTAEPEAIQFDPRQSAVVVVDMQNWDVKPGGFSDLTGGDITHAQKVIEPISHTLEATRRSGVTVIYLKNVISKDPLLRPDEDSPWFWKASRRKFDADPVLQRGMCIQGNWGAEIIDELAPVEGDLVIEKSLYSGFVRTDLELVLKRKGIRYLFLTGVGTPTCVDATARDAYFHEYWPIVLADCCNGIVPETHEQALAAIKRRYGWVTSSDELLETLPDVSQRTPEPSQRTEGRRL